MTYVSFLKNCPNRYYNRDIREDYKKRLYSTSKDEMMRSTTKYMGIFLVVLSFAGTYVIPSCRRPNLKKQKNTSSSGNKKNNIWITVWIHGTQICFGDPATKGIRAYVQQLAHTYFYCLQGLHSLRVQPESNKYYKFAEILEEEDPARFQVEHFYTYGWSGNLSFQEREQEGAKLYHQLLSLVALYKKMYGQKPRVRIISHSHGGNVALNLVAEEHKEHKHLIVDELILLACPVQIATVAYAQSPMFKKIYSLYTKFDVIQRIDPQGLYLGKIQNTPLFSQQRFPPSDTMIQAELTVARFGLPHVEMLSERFIRSLPHILTKLEKQKSE